MSLGRLLAAGKSLVGARDGAGRYRVNKHVALPKFISPRNPFATTGQLETASADEKPPAKTPGKVTVIATAKSDTVVGGNTSGQKFGGVRAARWFGEWGQKLNPLPCLRKPPGPAKSASPRFPDAAIQTELSLDKVQVVRSDLSDADLEVVPMKPKTPVVNVSAASVGKCELAASSWDRLTARIFGGGPS